jgi:putative endonuclease
MAPRPIGFALRTGLSSAAMVWSLYLLRTRDGSLYTGIALDVEKRLAEHTAGVRGAKALRGRGPLELVYRAEVGERGLAQGLEHRIKRLAKADKEQIVVSAPSTCELLDRFSLK